MSAIGSVHPLCISLAFLFYCLDYRGGSNGHVLTVAGRQVPGLLQHVIFLHLLCSLQMHSSVGSFATVDLRCSSDNKDIDVLAIYVSELVM